MHTAYLEPRRAASIWPYLTRSATAQLVLSAITSQFDYRNSILAGLPFTLSYRGSKTSLQNSVLESPNTYKHVTLEVQVLAGAVGMFFFGVNFLYFSIRSYPHVTTAACKSAGGMFQLNTDTTFVSDHTWYFWNWCDIYKVVKVVHGN